MIKYLIVGDDIMKKGFTLVELLAVIALLSLIALLTFPTIGNVLFDSKEKLYDEQVARIIQASKRYTAEHFDSLPMLEESTYLSIKKLQLSEMLKKGVIKNPKTNSAMVGCVKITFNEEANQYDYLYMDECEDKRSEIYYAGEEEIVIHQNDSFSMPEVVAYDYQGNELELDVTIKNGATTVESVDTSISTTYTITYKIKSEEKTLVIYVLVLE